MAAAFDLTKSLTQPRGPKPKPLNFQERTGHVIKNQENIIQHEVNNFFDFVSKKEMVINHKKSEVMVFNFSRNYAFPPDIKIGSADILREVSVTKLLGVKIQSDLKWAENTNYIVSRASNKLWLLRRMKRVGLEPEIIVDTYIKEIRSLLELAVPVWHSGLTVQQSDQIESIQKCAVSIVLNDYKLPYLVKCTLLNIEPLIF